MMAVARPAIRHIASVDGDQHGAELRRIAIVDDNLHEADAMSEIVRDAGYESVILQPPFDDVQDLLVNVQRQASAAICDHRLRGRGRFTGAEAVACFTNVKFPALLVTQYIGSDADVSIRLWRHRIPVLLSRDEADSVRIAAGIEECIREIQGEYPRGRRPWRTMIQIDGTAEDTGERLVEARVLSWNPREVVRFPEALVPPDLRGLLVPDAYMFAMVNIGAERADDLFFYDFEAAPEPEGEESLG